jgi:predicted NAD-dependent protein-ADP-ribosyltransferase YbiA (DUF1768 family)
MRPDREGIDHINAYSQSRTELGRLLSNFAEVPIVTEDGQFSSIEGYWYWLNCSHPARDGLRNLSGHAAKAFGRKLRTPDYPRGDFNEFRRKIKAAADAKIAASPRLRELLCENTLPIVHYYVYGDTTRAPDDGDWLWGHYETRAEELRGP